MNDGTGYNGFMGATPRHRPKPTTDLQYREAALRLAIDHFAAKGDHKVLSQQVVDVAKHFERYLRTGER